MPCSSCMSKKTAAKIQCLDCSAWREFRYRKNEPIRLAMSKRVVKCLECGAENFDINNAILDVPL